MYSGRIEIGSIPSTSNSSIPWYSSSSKSTTFSVYFSFFCFACGFIYYRVEIHTGTNFFCFSFIAGFFSFIAGYFYFVIICFSLGNLGTMGTVGIVSILDSVRPSASNTATSELGDLARLVAVILSINSSQVTAE